MSLNHLASGLSAVAHTAPSAQNPSSSLLCPDPLLSHCPAREHLLIIQDSAELFLICDFSMPFVADLCLSPQCHVHKSVEIVTAFYCTDLFTSSSSPPKLQELSHAPLYLSFFSSFSHSPHSPLLPLPPHSPPPPPF